MFEPTPQQNDIDTRAAEWVARIGQDRPPSRGERRRLDRWLGQSPAHRAAFEQARAAWAGMGLLRTAPGALAGDLARAKARTPPRRARKGWPGELPDLTARPALLAAAMAAVLWGGATVWMGDPRLGLAADHRTNPGERKEVTLPDGTVVQMGPATALALHFDAATRRIDLLSGIAYFTVAPLGPAEARPFVVTAAAGSARALGTEFMVDRRADGAEITVAQHQVAVKLERDGSDGRVLAPGQAVRYDGNGLAAVRPVLLDQATAWRQDCLVFDRRPLGEVVADLNRYRRDRIVIASAALAAHPVSGVFDTRDPAATLATITQVLGIRRASVPPFVTVLF